MRFYDKVKIALDFIIQASEIKIYSSLYKSHHLALYGTRLPTKITPTPHLALTLCR